MSQELVDISQFTKNAHSLQNISNSQWRKWIQESRKHPENIKLRQLLLQGLWDLQRFKDVIELLPPLAMNNFELSLKWHTQALLRLAMIGTAHVKKLIPIAVSYSFYLPDLESQTLLQFLDELVASKKDQKLLLYSQLVLSIAKDLQRTFNSLKIQPPPHLFLSPEIAAQVGSGTGEEIFAVLQKSQSLFSRYYAYGGHYLLLAEAGYFPEIADRERNLFSTELKFQLDVLTTFHRFTFKKMTSQLKSYEADLISKSFAQIFLAEQIQRFFAERNASAEWLENKENAKAVAEAFEYLNKLMKSIFNSGGQSAMILKRIYLQLASWRYQNPEIRFDATKIESLIEILNMAQKMDFELLLHPHRGALLAEIAPYRQSLETLLIHLYLKKLDLVGLSNFILLKERPNRKEIFLDIVSQGFAKCSESRDVDMAISKAHVFQLALKTIKLTDKLTIQRQKLLQAEGKKLIKNLKKAKGRRLWISI